MRGLLGLSLRVLNDTVSAVGFALGILSTLVLNKVNVSI